MARAAVMCPARIALPAALAFAIGAALSATTSPRQAATALAVGPSVAASAAESTGDEERSAAERDSRRAVASAGGALDAAASSSELAPPPLLARGRLVDVHGEPIAAAHVRGGSATCETDGLGRFELRGKPFRIAGGVRLEASAAGFLPARSAAPAGGEVGDWALRRGGALRGRVLLDPELDATSYEVFVPSSASSLDEHGAFELAGVPLGRQRVGLRATGWLGELPVHPAAFTFASADDAPPVDLGTWDLRCRIDTTDVTLRSRAGELRDGRLSNVAGTLGSAFDGRPMRVQHFVGGGEALVWAHNHHQQRIHCPGGSITVVLEPNFPARFVVAGTPPDLPAIAKLEVRRPHAHDVERSLAIQCSKVFTVLPTDGPWLARARRGEHAGPWTECRVTPSDEPLEFEVRW